MEVGRQRAENIYCRFRIGDFGFWIDFDLATKTRRHKDAKGGQTRRGFRR